MSGTPTLRKDIETWVTDCQGHGQLETISFTASVCFMLTYTIQ